MKVNSGESCLVCGDELVIETDAKQDTLEHEMWRAVDGDPANCPDCGFQAYVTVDDQIADINWDETSEHNLKCAEEYESDGMVFCPTCGGECKQEIIDGKCKACRIGVIQPWMKKS